MAMRYKLEEQVNDNEKAAEEELNNDQNAKGITIKIKKKTLKTGAVIIIVLAIVLGFLLTQTRKIDGTWIRVADDNDLVGMIVKVENGEGVIVKTSPNNSLGYGFSEGQIKWKNIKKTGWGQYTFSDLVSEDESATTFYDGSVSRMEVSMNGKKLTLTVQAGELSGRTGWYQEWEKK